MQKLIQFCTKNIGLLVIASLTLGLAPFTPEPHVWEKLKWVARGAEGMAWFDWFDLLLHGSPWALLGLGLAGKVSKPKASKNQ